MSFRDYLNEGNDLSRIFMSAQNPNTCMTILTGSRNENSDEQNEKNNDEIRSELKRLKIGFRTAEGHYPGEDPNDPTKEVDHIDDSTIIILNSKHEDFLKKFAIDVCVKYEQEAVLFKKSTGEIGFYDKNGNFDEIGKNFHANKISDYMTVLKNKYFKLSKKGIGKPQSFVFENVSDLVRPYIPSQASALHAYHLRKEFIESH